VISIARGPGRGVWGLSEDGREESRGGPRPTASSSAEQPNYRTRYVYPCLHITVVGQLA
jgi:hypothetical protein